MVVADDIRPDADKTYQIVSAADDFYDRETRSLMIRTPEVSEHNTARSSKEHPLGPDLEALLDPVVGHDADKLQPVHKCEEAAEGNRVKRDGLVLQDIDDGARGVVDVRDQEVTQQIQEGLLEAGQVLRRFPDLLGTHGQPARVVGELLAGPVLLDDEPGDRGDDPDTAEETYDDRVDLGVLGHGGGAHSIADPEADEDAKHGSDGGEHQRDVGQFGALQHVERGVVLGVFRPLDDFSLRLNHLRQISDEHGERGLIEGGRHIQRQVADDKESGCEGPIGRRCKAEEGERSGDANDLCAVDKSAVCFLRSSEPESSTDRPGNQQPRSPCPIIGIRANNQKNGKLAREEDAVRIENE